jgi:RNA polymerase sigma-70 factor (ECF subfamily)
MDGDFVATWMSVFRPVAVCAPPERWPRGIDGVQRVRMDAADAADDTPSPAQQPPRLTEIDGYPVEDVLSQLRDGSRAALTSIYRALHVPLWRLATILTRSTMLADEILQDVFFSLWVRRASIEPSMNIRAYLYASVRNQARRSSRHARIVTDVEVAVGRGSLGIPALGEEVMPPDRAAEIKEFSDAFRYAVATLTERERRALQLRIEEELTFDEIGQILGVSKMGAHKIVARAETKIRGLLAAYRP